jgi:hypothetical protein
MTGLRLVIACKAEVEGQIAEFCRLTDSYSKTKGGAGQVSRQSNKSLAC